MKLSPFRPAALLSAFILVASVSPSQEVPQETEYEEDDAPAYEYQEEPVVRSALEEVLSRPEFQRLREKQEEDEEEEVSEEPAWLKRFFEWLEDWLGPAEREESASLPSFSGLDFIVYAIAGVILAAAIVLIVKSIASSSSVKSVDDGTTEAQISGPGTPPGERSPDEYLQRAMRYAEQRQFKSAIRELLLGAMSFLERRGTIRYRKGLTNRDYLRAAKGEGRESLRTVVRHFELVFFGRREASAEGFDECRKQFEKSFRG